MTDDALLILHLRRLVRDVRTDTAQEALRVLRTLPKRAMPDPDWQEPIKAVREYFGISPSPEDN